MDNALAVVRADKHARSPAPDGLIPLTCNEVQRLFITLVVRPALDTAHPAMTCRSTWPSGSGSRTAS